MPRKKSSGFHGATPLPLKAPDFNGAFTAGHYQRTRGRGKQAARWASLLGDDAHLQDLEAFAVPPRPHPVGMATRPGVQRPHLTIDLLGALSPVDPTIFLGDLARVGGLRGILATRL